MTKKALLLLIPCLLLSGPDSKRIGFDRQVPFQREFRQTLNLRTGQTVEVSAGIMNPSQLPANGRLAVEWAGYRKVIHALDPDFYIVFRAPAAGPQTLRITPVEHEEPIFNIARWREPGAISKLQNFPKDTRWPAATKVQIRAAVKEVEYGESTRGLVVEAEPNDSMPQAQPLVLQDDTTLHITGGADDIEYFDNGKNGDSGDDWFRLEFKGSPSRLFTANLILTDPLVVARLRFYDAAGKEYRQGQNQNERVHQQVEEHRTEINRTLQPGQVYFLRVEANAPGYDLELRVRQPAPYTDPRMAVRQAMYDHLAQVHAWLQNRPRGASVDRRIRDTGNLMGTHCMSCHTQSGVWGPTGPMLNGYRPENPRNYRQLINIAYESMRPTNELKDAANNTSLQPLDLGDGPAGTRVAGYNVTTLETFLAPRKLHSMQQIRAANFVLLSADPGGVNAAGPGSNVGPAVVFRFAGEILKRAWERTGEQRYYAGLTEKAEKLLNIAPKYSDDLSNRLDFFARVFPKDHSDRNLMARIAAQASTDEKRLRAIQSPDGAWGFDPGTFVDGVRWNRKDDPKDLDPAPTALGITALASLGYGANDPAIGKAVEWLLKKQDAYGRWNEHAITGFVTTAYTMHALSRIYSETPVVNTRADFEAKPGESLADTIARFRALAQLGLNKGDAAFLDIAIKGVAHPSPHVRYWAMIALGMQPSDMGVAPLIKGLGDPVKMVREAARWSMRQTLLDDRGWNELLKAAESGDDLAREQAAAALIMRADTIMPKSQVDIVKLAGSIDRMMNDDRSPAVRAWSTRAAWNWWIWNPPVRGTLNAAFLRTLESPESSVLAENAKRYQTQALFIANGHRSNPSKEHQYKELQTLFTTIGNRLEGSNKRLRDRIVAVSGTYYSMSGHDGGPGQMGYITEGSAAMTGKAVLGYWGEIEGREDPLRLQLVLEAAANVTDKKLQDRLLQFASSGPEKFRTLAASSIADPRVVTLPASTEFVEPLADQIERGAIDRERREQLAAPLIKLFTRARWNMPKTAEQQRMFFALLKPKLTGPIEEPQWYLADQLGRMLGANPDFRTDTLMSEFPTEFRNTAEELYWLPSVRWILAYGRPVPQVRSDNRLVNDHWAEVRRRASQLYVKALADGADERLKKAALAIAFDNYIRTDPIIQPVLAKAKPDYFEPLPAEVATLSPAARQNFEYFRQYVMAEMNRPNREDEFACFSCHGVKGRVPTMELAAPDRQGYLKESAIWTNYRILSDKIDRTNVETSKFLRKPLNIQTGQEDGHQGDRRYQPGDPGYEIIRRWVMDLVAMR